MSATELVCAAAVATVCVFNFVFGPLSLIAAGADGKFGHHTRKTPTPTLLARVQGAWKRLIAVPAPLAWACMELPAFATFALFTFCSTALDRGDMSATTATVQPLVDQAAAIVPLWAAPHRNPLVLLFGLHYFHRAIIFPLRIALGSAGQAAPYPLYTVPMASFYCAVNGLAQCAAAFGPTVASPYRAAAPVFAFLFVLCAWWNWVADAYLLLLVERRRNATTPADAGYAIPMETEAEVRALPSRYRGAVAAVFKRVDMAHYFFEISEWWCYALGSALAASRTGTALDWAPVVFALGTTVMLTGRGLPRHWWYQRTFGPRYTRLNRRGVIPFLC
jgi:hypothetical protein